MVIHEKWETATDESTHAAMRKALWNKGKLDDALEISEQTEVQRFLRFSGWRLSLVANRAKKSQSAPWLLHRGGRHSPPLSEVTFVESSISHWLPRLPLIFLAVGILSSQAVVYWLRDVGAPAGGVCASGVMAGSVPMNIDWKLVVQGATFVAAVVAFAVGLVQYRRAQQWKRAEFLAQEMKELFADLKCTNALTMIDWAAREIPLGAFLTPPDPTRVAVDYVQQSDALRPHDFEPLEKKAGAAPSPGAVESAAPHVASKDGNTQFDQRQTLIRDCYDGLLDRLDRVGSYITRGLISVEDLRPYIGYYVTDIAADAKSADEALWSASLLTYIIFYHFDGVAALFKAFKKDISPGGTAFKGFVERAGQYRDRAEQLQKVAGDEWNEMKERLPGNSAT